MYERDRSLKKPLFEELARVVRGSSRDGVSCAFLCMSLLRFFQTLIGSGSDCCVARHADAFVEATTIESRLW
jgi:hypothetical protein